jgi:Fe-S-cluster containining protein
MSECSNPCGGECCRNFTLTVRPEDLPAYLENAREAMAAGTANEYQRDAVFWLPHIHPAAPHADGIPRYRCDLLGADGRCTIYAARPRTCREYPSADHGARCGACGYQSVAGIQELTLLTKAPATA